LRIGIKANSSNIIGKLGENEDTKGNSAVELVNSKKSSKFAELVTFCFVD